MTLQQLGFVLEVDQPHALENQNEIKTLNDLAEMAKHPVFYLGSALFRGDPEIRARRVLMLERMIDAAGNSVAADGVVRDLTISELQGLVEELPPDEVSDLVHKLSQDGLVICEGKTYQVAPLAAALVQFIRFIVKLEDETGASAAVISSVFSYQLEIGRSDELGLSRPELVTALKTVILDIDRYNTRLEQSIRRLVLSDLGAIVNDLKAVNYFCGILDDLVRRMSLYETPGDVYWQERARRVLRRFQELATALNHAYDGRLQRFKSGGGRYVSDEVLEKWLIHALVNEQGNIVTWMDQLDRPAYLSTFPCWMLKSLIEDGPPDSSDGEMIEKEPLISTVALVDEPIAGTPDSDAVMHIISDMVAFVKSKNGAPFQVSDLILPEDWFTSAARISYLGIALESIELETGERWVVDSSPYQHKFQSNDQVASISNAEVGKWIYLIQKRIEPNKL